MVRRAYLTQSGLVLGTGKITQTGQTVGVRILTAASRYALLVLFAKALTPEDLGAYTLVTSVSALGIILVGLDANLYMYRTVPGQPRESALRIFESIAFFELISCALVIFVLGFTGAFDAALRLLQLQPYRLPIALGAVLLLFDVLYQDVALFLWARERSRAANIVDLLRQAAWLLIPATLLLSRGTLSVEVMVGATIVGSVAAVVYGFASIRPRLTMPSLSIVAQAVRFSWPLMLPALGFFVMRLGDRFVLSASRTLEEVGVYSLAGSLVAALYSLSAQSVTNVLIPQAVRLHNHDQGEARDRTIWAATKYSLWSFIACSVPLGFAALVAIQLLGRADYERALLFYPAIAGAYIFLVLSAPPQYLLWMQGRSQAVLVIDVISTVLAISLYLVLIPTFGGFGAAAATMAGFGTSALLKLGATRLLWTYPWLDLVSFRRETTILRDRIKGLR
jgi:PST family polysaccharide transporter